VTNVPLGATYQWYRSFGASYVAITGATEAVYSTTQPEGSVQYFCSVGLDGVPIPMVTAPVLVTTHTAGIADVQGVKKNHFLSTETFTLTVNGASTGITPSDLQYQWYKGSGVLVGGKTSDPARNITQTETSAVYYCVVSSGGVELYTNTVPITVLNVDSLIETVDWGDGGDGRQGVEIAKGHYHFPAGQQFTLALSNLYSNQAVSYQWFRNDVSVKGPTVGDSTLTTFENGDRAVYRCSVTFGGPATPIAAFTITTVSPGNAVVLGGKNHFLSTEAFALTVNGASTGIAPSNLRYTWYKGNGVLVRGESSDPAATGIMQSETSAVYYCVVSSSGVTVETNRVTITVLNVNDLNEVIIWDGKGDDSKGREIAKGHYHFPVGKEFAFTLQGQYSNQTIFYQWYEKIGDAGTFLPMPGKTSSTLAHAQSVDRAYYECRATFGGPAIPIANFTVTTVKPGTLAVDGGKTHYLSTATFTLTVSGSSTGIVPSDLAYRWFKHGAHIADAPDSPSYPTKQSESSAVYYCEVSSRGVVVETNRVTITALNVDDIVIDIVDDGGNGDDESKGRKIENGHYHFPAGQQFTFALSSLESGQPVYYQWFRNGASIKGPTLGDSTLKESQTAEVALYYCQVTSGDLSYRAADFKVTTLTAGTAVVDGGKTHFLSTDLVTLRVNGSKTGIDPADLQYQWRKNGVLHGTKTSDPAISFTQSEPSAVYYCEVSSGGVTLKTNTVTIHALNVGDIDVDIDDGGNGGEGENWKKVEDRHYHIAAGEPFTLSLSGLGSGQTVSYEWFEGTTSKSQTSTCLILQSENTANYRCVVTFGDLEHTVEFKVTTLTKGTAVVVGGKNHVRTTDAFTLRVEDSRSGITPIHYQWFRIEDGESSPKTTDPVLGLTQSLPVGTYYCEVSSGGITLKTTPPITIYALNAENIDIDIVGGGDGCDKCDKCDECKGGDECDECDECDGCDGDNGSQWKEIVKGRHYHVPAGELFTLSLSGLGSSQSISYQWFKDGDPVTAPSPNSAYPTTQTEDSADYHCMVTFGDLAPFKAADFKVTTLTRGTATVEGGKTHFLSTDLVTLRVNGSKTGIQPGDLEYQWYKDGDLHGGKSGDPALTFYQKETSAEYHCEVSSGGITLKTNRVTVTVFNVDDIIIDIVDGGDGCDDCDDCDDCSECDECDGCDGCDGGNGGQGVKIAEGHYHFPAGQQFTFALSKLESGQTVFYQWFKDGDHVTEPSEDSTFKYAQTDDTAYYHCLATSGDLDPFKVADFKVTTVTAGTAIVEEGKTHFLSTDTFTFTVDGSSTGIDPGDLEYQWYRDDGVLLGDKTDAPGIILQQSASSVTYYCEVSSGGITLETNRVTITVLNVDDITVGGGDKCDECDGCNDCDECNECNGCDGCDGCKEDNGGQGGKIAEGRYHYPSGQQFTLALSNVESGLPVFYQWFKDGDPVTNPTEGDSALTDSQTDDTAEYHCEVTSGELSFTAATFTVTTVTAGAVTIVEGEALFEVGEEFTLTAPDARSGLSNITYQWFRNGVAVTAPSDTSVYKTTQSASRADYFCRVTSGGFAHIWQDTDTVTIYTPAIDDDDGSDRTLYNRWGIYEFRISARTSVVRGILVKVANSNSLHLIHYRIPVRKTYKIVMAYNRYAQDPDYTSVGQGHMWTSDNEEAKNFRGELLTISGMTADGTVSPIGKKGRELPAQIEFFDAKNPDSPNLFLTGLLTLDWKNRRISGGRGVVYSDDIHPGACINHHSTEQMLRKNSEGKWAYEMTESQRIPGRYYPQPVYAATDVVADGKTDVELAPVHFFGTYTMRYNASLTNKAKGDWTKLSNLAKNRCPVLKRTDFDFTAEGGKH